MVIKYEDYVADPEDTISQASQQILLNAVCNDLIAYMNSSLDQINSHVPYTCLLETEGHIQYVSIFRDVVTLWALLYLSFC